MREFPASIDFPNRAAAEIDLYGGVRPTFGKLALELDHAIEKGRARRARTRAKVSRRPLSWISRTMPLACAAMRWRYTALARASAIKRGHRTIPQTGEMMRHYDARFARSPSFTP